MKSVKLIALGVSVFGASVAQAQSLKLGAVACTSRQVVEMSNDSMLSAYAARGQHGCKLLPKGTPVQAVQQGDSTSFVVRGVRVYATWAAINP